VIAHYLDINFDLFFQKYNNILIQSSSYVTKRQSIKLLGEILLDRANYSVMTEYVARGEHLKLCMNLLKDDRKMVQYEGFHVFKVRPAPETHNLARLRDPLGLRGEPKQITSSAANIGQQPRSAPDLPAQVSRRPDR